MYVDRTLSHATFYMYLFLSTLVAGLILGLILPLSWIGTPIIILSNISYRLMLYFTVPYLFFSLLISTYELSKTHQLLYIIRQIIKTGLIITLIIMSISIVIFVIFIPNQNIISLISKQHSIPTISITDIVSNVFSISWNISTYASQVLLIPFFILAIIVGINSKNIIDARHPLLEACNGLRAINLKILENIFPWYSIATIIMIMRNISTVRTMVDISNFMALLLFLPLLALILIFLVYPLLLKWFRIPIPYHTWCKQIIPALSIAFAGGNMATASVALLYVEDLNNPQSKVTDTTIALSFMFSRVGTAVTIALSYIIVNKIYTAIPLDFLQILLILGVSILFSLITNAIASPIILSGVATLSYIPSIIVQDLYLSILPLGIVLHCLASVIDIATCGFMKLYLSNILHLRNTSLGFTLHQ